MSNQREAGVSAKHRVVCLLLYAFTACLIAVPVSATEVGANDQQQVEGQVESLDHVMNDRTVSAIGGAESYEKQVEKKVESEFEALKKKVSDLEDDMGSVKADLLLGFIQMSFTIAVLIVAVVSAVLATVGNMPTWQDKLKKLIDG